jgi:hypothetical protein
MASNGRLTQLAGIGSRQQLTGQMLILSSTINASGDRLQRLDYVLSAAEKHGIKRVIPFV